MMQIKTKQGSRQKRSEVKSLKQSESSILQHLIYAVTSTVIMPKATPFHVTDYPGHSTNKTVLRQGSLTPLLEVLLFILFLHLGEQDHHPFSQSVNFNSKHYLISDRDLYISEFLSKLPLHSSPPVTADLRLQQTSLTWRHTQVCLPIQSFGDSATNFLSKT